MQKIIIALTFATIGALACATPAAAQSASSGAGDARAEQEQAQLHPWEANQAPEAVPGGIAFGEVYLPGDFASPIEPTGSSGRLMPGAYQALVGAPADHYCQLTHQWTAAGWREDTVCY